MTTNLNYLEAENNKRQRVLKFLFQRRAHISLNAIEKPKRSFSEIEVLDQLYE